MANLVAMHDAQRKAIAAAAKEAASKAKRPAPSVLETVRVPGENAGEVLRIDLVQGKTKAGKDFVSLNLGFEDAAGHTLGNPFRRPMLPLGYAVAILRNAPAIAKGFGVTMAKGPKASTTDATDAQ